MPRYFFNVRHGKDGQDTEGTELSSLDEARVQAIRSAGEMISQEGNTIWNGRGWLMEVSDQSGNPLFTLRFSARSVRKGAAVYERR
jgi:hypothetical protein